MRRLLALALAALACLTLAACGAPREAEEADGFTLRLLCESEDIYQIFYTCYIGGDARCMGGAADLDGGELSPQTPLEMPVLQMNFEEGDDLSTFSIDLSPYGENDTAELGTTAPVAFPVQWGETYTLVLSGNAQQGFTAALEE